MNRRDFNRLGLLAAASWLRAETFDYPWKLGIITDEADPDLARTLASFFPKYHLKWAEIRNVKLAGKNTYVYSHATPDQVRQIKQQLDDAAVNVSVLDTGIYKIALPGTTPLTHDPTDLNPVNGVYEKQLDDLKRAAAAAHTLGTDRLRIFAFLRVADPAALHDRLVDELNKAIEVAKQQGVTLLLENEHTCNVGTGTETARLLSAIPDRTLLHNWDPGNCAQLGEQPFPKAWDQLDHSRIGHMHLKDAQGKTWKPIGGGEIDFVGQFRALKQMNYSATMSLETHYRNAARDPYTSSVESMDGLVRVLKQV
jgi:sugar phosphate isomerase/epimerase